MTLSPPVTYDASVETVLPDEEKTVLNINNTFDTILNKTSADYGHAVRAVHAKAHGIIEATFVVRDGLPPDLAQGLFAHPGSHKAYMRLSTNAGDILPDQISLPRGLAIKVVDVLGERLPEAQGNCQDFVMVNGPVFQARTAEKFEGSLKMLAKTTDRLEATKEVISSVLQSVNSALQTFGLESPSIQSLGGAPNVDPLGETYFSVTPFRYGDYIAKFSIRPMSKDLKDLKGRQIDATHEPDAVRTSIQAEMAHLTAEWEFCVQLCRDLEAQPIEDPTVAWNEQDAPFIAVATIHAEQQDTWSDKKVQRVDEEMRFSVWTGIAAHRPLGNINRARKATYEHSSRYRQAFNGCPIHEPSS